MVSQPPTKAPNCSRERTSGRDHGPAEEITPTTDHGRRPEVLGTDQMEEANQTHMERVARSATSVVYPTHLGSAGRRSTEASKTTEATKAVMQLS